MIWMDTKTFSDDGLNAYPPHAKFFFFPLTILYFEKARGDIVDGLAIIS